MPPHRSEMQTFVDSHLRHCCQVRLVQNKEPDHFFQIFHGGVIVNLGGLNNEDEGKEGPNRERLYQIKGYNPLDTHAVQVSQRPP